MRRRRRNISRERFLMISASLLVLGSLTATGLWLGREDNSQNEGYVVDLSAIENSGAAGAAKEDAASVKESVVRENSLADDLDYDPYFQETNSQRVENPDQSESDSMSQQDPSSKEQEKSETAKKEKEGGQQEEDGQNEQDTDTPALSTAMQPALNFSDTDTLMWPVVGNILVNYSMDKTVYFPTLDQYKYNPAIMIEATQGDLITAACAGKVTSVFKDPQIGNAVKMELGGGYEVTYGQLTGILVSEGSYVAAGDVIAQVAAPTKYYSLEGTNVYFALTKDGEPVNPMSKLN